MFKAFLIFRRQTEFAKREHGLCNISYALLAKANHIKYAFCLFGNRIIVDSKDQRTVENISHISGNKLQ